MTYKLRPNWRADVGPLSLPMPDDGAGPVMDLAHLPAVHEDDEDRINADGSHGPDDVGAPGGSGIVHGYSTADLGSVVALEAAVQKRKASYNLEHWVREKRYAEAGWDMTHDRYFAARIVALDEIATGTLSADAQTVHLGDAGWSPNTLAQYNALAHATPGVGLGWNGREFGWASHGRAMRRKVARVPSTVWDLMLLETCAMAACEGTGQIISDFNTGGDPLNEGKVQYSFHWGLFVHGVLALCFRLRRPAPEWVVQGMASLAKLPRLDYFGCPSMPSFTFSHAGKLLPATGPGQKPDPAFGWWGSNCVALARVTGDGSWLRLAPLYGPRTAVDEQSRKFTMLERGWRAHAAA